MLLLDMCSTHMFILYDTLYPIKGVKRKLAAGRADLDPGWYSAMGQGQAMSLLMRAFYRSGFKEFLFPINF